jgi:glucuronate isomerase
MEDMQSQVFPLSLHPDRLLPVEPSVRDIARRLYKSVRDLPIISPHGHVDPRILLDNAAFRDPAQLFVTPDHYVTRLLHASGVPLESRTSRPGARAAISGSRRTRRACVISAPTASTSSVTTSCRSWTGPAPT